MVKYFPIFVLVACSFVLTGCLGFGNTTTTVDDTGLSKYA